MKGEAVVFVPAEDVEALIRAVEACGVVATSEHSPEHVSAETRLRGVLQAARGRLERVGLEPGFYLDLEAWPLEGEVPLFLDGEDVDALRRAGAACFALADADHPQGMKFLKARRAISRILDEAGAEPPPRP